MNVIDRALFMVPVLAALWGSGGTAIAGAIGKVWVMLRCSADWRWFAHHDEELLVFLHALVSPAEPGDWGAGHREHRTSLERVC